MSEDSGWPDDWEPEPTDDDALNDVFNVMMPS